MATTMQSVILCMVIYCDVLAKKKGTPKKRCAFHLAHLCPLDNLYLLALARDIRRVCDKFDEHSDFQVCFA